MASGTLSHLSARKVVAGKGSHRDRWRRTWENPPQNKDDRNSPFAMRRLPHRVLAVFPALCPATFGKTFRKVLGSLQIGINDFGTLDILQGFCGVGLTGAR